VGAGGSDGARAGRAEEMVRARSEPRAGAVGDPDAFGAGVDGLGDRGTEDRVAGGGRAAVSGGETGEQVGRVPFRLWARRREGGKAV